MLNGPGFSIGLLFAFLLNTACSFWLDAWDNQIAILTILDRTRSFVWFSQLSFFAKTGKQIIGIRTYIVHNMSPCKHVVNVF